MATPEVIEKALNTTRQHLEELLQESEDRFRLIADATPVMIWMADSNQLYDYFNQVWLEFTGYSLEQQLDNGWVEAIHPKDKEQRQTLYSNAFDAREKFQIQYRLRRADGQYRWVLDTGVPRFTPGGNFVGYIGSCIDITDRKQVEEKLQQEIAQRLKLQEALARQQQQQQVILDAVPAMIWFKDTENSILRVNQVAATAVGLSVEEIEGKSTYEIYPNEAAQYHQDDLDVIQSGLPKLGIVELLQTPSGEKRWIQTDKIPWRSDDGNIAGVMVFAIDITERIALEKELVLRQSRFDAFFEAAPAGLMIMDNQVRFVHINKTLAQMNGLEVAFCLGRTLTEVLPELGETLEPIIRQILTTGEPMLNLELSAESAKQPGVELHCIASYFPLIGEDGKLIGIGGVLIEITHCKQAETALRESEERLGAIFNQAAVGINLAQLNGSLLLVNQKFCDLVGYTQEEMLLRTFQEITHPEDLSIDWEYACQLIAGEIQTYSIEKRYLHKQGFLVWVNLTMSLVRSPDGEPKYMISIVQDISDRIALEKELALRQARFDAFFTTAPVGLEIIDKELRFAHINQTLAEMDGCSVAQHQGKTIAQIVPKMASDLEAMCQHILTTGESILNLEEVGETPKEPGVLRYWMSSRFPLLGEDDQPIAVGGVCIEITERKRTEEALKASEAQLRLALNAAQMGVWDWDIETGRVTHSEREQSIFGLTPGEFDGTYETYFTKIHPEDQSRVTQANQNTIEKGTDYDIDYRIILPDNTIHWVREKGAVLRDETGKAVRMIGITMDITDRKQAEESLRQSEERYRKLAQQEELLYRISSQIRNSLNLDTILETAVGEIRNLLQIDRCLFLWYRDRSSSAAWEVVHEAKPADLPSLLGCYPAEVLEPQGPPLLNSGIQAVDNVQNLQDVAARKLLESLGYNSLLNLPIRTLSGELGVVACINGNSFRSWTEEDVELLCAVCDQLAIAINQAELYAQSRAAATVATQKATQLELALHSLQQTQTQLIQTEKMSSLGQLVAGVAHEINNPVSFIYGNVDHASAYTKDLLSLLELYRDAYPQPLPKIQGFAEAIDLDFLVEDLPKALFSMKVGADRIRDLVLSLRNFSRLDEAEMKPVDIHEGIDNTLLILQHRLKEKAGYPLIQIIKEYGQLPLINCYPGQLNQVFMNLISNAIDALESSEVSEIKTPIIRIRTQINDLGYITIRIADNGSGMREEVLSRLFDPFFTTKPIGKGTGLGLSISYQIVVEKHQGTLQCHSELGKGTEFVVTLPQGQRIDSRG